MALSGGCRLGPYEILSPLGAGGMGEVYRASDTRLERTVAIKVLNSSLAASPELKARFEREARAISQLNHPNICTLHDVGHDSGTDFLVMEYIEGESLAERLRKGPLPLDELLKVGMETADALDKAHRAGIVHRDLKPGNVMLAKMGAKLLDFGLAKPAAMGATAGSGSAPLLSAAMTMASHSPQHSPLTSAGMLVGTVQYMSPEQIEGKEADGRSDIFALGALLYEMATGRRAFEGKSQLSVASSILEKDPQPVTEVLSSGSATGRPPRMADAVPAASGMLLLERVISDCLAKSPDDRYQSAHDVMLDLAAVSSLGSRIAPARESSPLRLGRRGWLPAALAVLLVLAIAALAMVLLRRAEAPGVRASITVGKGVDVFPFDMAFSPDGTNLAFVATSGMTQSLWVRPIGSAQARALAGSEDARYPFWAPDGRRIGFFADSKLKIVDLSGGSVVAVADAPDGRGGAWNKDDVIVYAPNLNGPLWRVAASGGAATQLTELDAKVLETGHRWPVFLPDGRHLVIYVVGARSSGAPSLDPTDKTTGLYSLDLQTKEKKFLTAADSGATYASGYMLYFHRQNLMAQTFDAGSLRLRGTPVALAQEPVGYDSDRWSAAFAVASNGLLSYVSRNMGVAQLEWLDRAGKLLAPLPTPDFIPIYPALSPDGKRLAVAQPTGQQNDIWIIELERGTKSRLTFDGGSYAPVWSPDGKRVAYTSLRDKSLRVFVKEANGLGEEQAVAMPGADTFTVLTDWSRDGSAMVVQSSGANARNRLFVHWMSPGHKDGWLLPEGAPSAGWREAVFSPDGKWIAYSANESGRWEIYVVPFPQVNGKFQVSTNGGMQPRWRRDGKELFFVGLDRKLYAVPVSTQATFHAGNLEALFTEAQVFTLPPATAQYEAAADGKRFLVVRRSAQEGGSEPITLITNWMAELKK